MNPYPRAEIEAAFQTYLDTVDDICKTGDWSRFADRFAEDATYIEHSYGTFAGRDEIRAWIVDTMTAFPGSAMVGFPPSWSVIDEERGWVLCEIRNIMADPGDGSVHEAPNITILRYGGNGLFANEEDVYNPLHFLTMVRDWARVCIEHGTLPADGEAWVAKFAPDLLANSA